MGAHQISDDRRVHDDEVARLIDGDRMKKDYELVQTYLGMEKPFDVTTSFTTKMLDPAIKMDASKVKK